MKIYCCNCEKKIEAELVKGDVIYPHRKDLYNLNFYRCPICKRYVGCHKGTTRPLGVIPTKEIKAKRILIHSIIDPLWKSKKIGRKTLYTLISNQIGYTYHTGNIKSVQEADRIIKIAKLLKQAEEKTRNDEDTDWVYENCVGLKHYMEDED